MPPNTKHHETAQWAIRLLVTQLYDTDVEVCETAVKILEEICNVTHNLEYVVKCRPALDHLGEIGAPLLLRYDLMFYKRKILTVQGFYLLPLDIITSTSLTILRRKWMTGFM